MVQRERGGRCSGRSEAARVVDEMQLACLLAYSAADDAATLSLRGLGSVSSVRGSPRLLPLAGSQVGFTSMAAPVIG
jgi:hypothetical protein